MRDHVLLYINGRLVRVSGEDVFLTLSDLLRKRERLTGTKVVCAEGDCGSCAVLIGRVEGREMRYGAVTSCIQLTLQLDGCHVVTVEGLREGPSLNPLQQAMVNCHGAQCGFCTPGFVVTLYDLLRDGKPACADAVQRGLVGNLCRCTGYEAILKAAMSVEPGTLKKIDELYPPGPIVEMLSQAAREEVAVSAGARRFYKPTDVGRAAQFRADHPGCTIIAGGTDVGVLYNKRVRPIDVALGTAGLSSLRGIRLEEGSLYIGAGSSLAALERATLEHIPEFGKFLSWFGSPLIKNAGTVGGNLVTGSPIGDTLPAMIALGAELELAGINGTRRVPISAFYTGYRQTVMTADELLVGVRIPLLKGDERLKLYKVSRRKDLDISTFGAAIYVKRTHGGPVDDIRIVYGGVGPMVVRLPGAEAVIRGEMPTLERFAQAGKIAREEVKPISDVRGAESYRRSLAENILSKCWHELFGTPSGDGDGAKAPSPDGGASARSSVASGVAK